MSSLETIREALGDAHRDTRLNLPAVLEAASLAPEQRWGVALACAYAVRNAPLRQALEAEARRDLPEAEPILEDARAAASLMAMTNVYYRFRTMVGKDSYSERRPGLRMNRMIQLQGRKVDYELMCLAVSALNGCASCVRSHEHSVLEGGLTEEQVHDAVRIAAVVHAAAVGLESSGG